MLAPNAIVHTNGISFVEFIQIDLNICTHKLQIAKLYISKKTNGHIEHVSKHISYFGEAYFLDPITILYLHTENVHGKVNTAKTVKISLYKSFVPFA